MLRVAESAPKLLERKGFRFVSLGLQRLLEVCDERTPEHVVGDGSSDDVVEPGAASRQLLSRSHPALGGGRERPQKVRKAFFVVWAGLGHRLQDGSDAEFLPSITSRSFARQREMRLAIVPAGMSSASPIV
jgi:hypothetical protein